jgi:hypothetical protein
MLEKRIGDPCPKCSAALMRRRCNRSFRTETGDVAYCARCDAAWEIAKDEVAAPPLLAPAV